jgi:hypothetical protein
MQVDSLMVDDGSATYYTDEVRNTLEDFMTVFRTSPTTQSVPVDPGDAQRFEYDFYGLLTYMSVPMKYHFAVMRTNNMVAPTDYRAYMLTYLMPDQGEIDRIVQTLNSTSTTTN